MNLGTPIFSSWFDDRTRRSRRRTLRSNPTINIPNTRTPCSKPTAIFGTLIVYLLLLHDGCKLKTFCPDFFVIVFRELNGLSNSILAVADAFEQVAAKRLT
jgi:hypothetical protein